MVKDDYANWSLQTDYRRKKRICWDSRHQADVWKNSDQVTNLDNGTSKVVCKRLEGVIEHLGGGNGTLATIKHIKAQGC